MIWFDEEVIFYRGSFLYGVLFVSWENGGKMVEVRFHIIK